MEETTTFQGLRHLFMTVFLHGFSAFIVVPVITDVSMAALCPGKDECSLAIYLSGFQQAITGVGSLMMMPLVGSLSDKHGRKSLLTLPMALNILPLGLTHGTLQTFDTSFDMQPASLVIFRSVHVPQLVSSLLEANISYNIVANRTTLTCIMLNVHFEESLNSAICLLKSLNGMYNTLDKSYSKASIYNLKIRTSSTLLLRVFEQSFVLIHFTSPCKPQIHDHTRDKNIFLSRTCSDTNSILAYSRETSVFYIYYVLKTFTSIFCEGSVFCLALAYVVATTVAIFSTVYMRIFLPDSIRDNSLVTSIVSTEKLSYVLLEDYPGHRNQISRTVRSVREMASLMRSSVPLFQVAMVSFFSSLSEAGLHASSMYYLKAKFQFNKDQFADLMIIFGIAGSVSQLLFMPILIPALKEEKLLSIGLFFGCAHMFLLGMAWSAWVPYMAAMFSLVSIFHQSCMRSIVSKQVTSYEQGKAQGIISSICSLANVISPLAFSPLTGWFLSERAPFHFPGFSLMCAGFTMVI
ncbi:BnaC02g29920D [Brassica napus]|uniref:BnaC02g29920D protein n=1 Tax=Brassica napus TaxID=3708 RepID=A0A078FF13_BRANA|nr:BnaC02g29920D [Brassica napus]